MLNVYGLTRTEWAGRFVKTEMGISLSEASRMAKIRNVFRALYQEGSPPSSGLISDRSKSCLSSQMDWECPVVLEEAIESHQDGSVKLLMRQNSSELRFEAVLIPERGRLTLCVSSQVGCAQGCRFCQTGRMGLLASLTAAEIIGQVVVAQDYWQHRPEAAKLAHAFGANRISNIVFMGMGEPLDNRLEVQKACEILADPWGLAIGRKRITVSTVGLLPELSQFLDETNVALALSLHSPFDEERSRFMPVNRKHPLSEILKTLRQKLRPGAHVFVQYTLMRGVNDSEEHAISLAQQLKGLPCKVNLIPLNEHDGAAFRRPSLERVEAFRAALKGKGLVVTLRFSKGRAIDAACGQLVKTFQRGEAADRIAQIVQ